MASDEAEGNARHVYGPRPVGALLPAITRPAFRRRAPAAAQVMADWAAIVGPALAAVTAPRRLSGTGLTVACSGPIALELQHMTAELCARINAHAGRVVVERVRFVQDATEPPRPAPQAAARRPAARADPPLPGVPDGPLRDALLALGRALAAERS